MKSITQSTLLFLALLLSTPLWAQLGVGTNTPNAAAALHVLSPNKGVLIPSIPLNSATVFAPLTGTSSTTHNGMLVWNTSPATANGLSGVGFYYWENSPTTAGQGQWFRLTSTLDNSLPSGTVTHTSLRWDGTAWVENQALQSDGSGTTTLTTDLVVAANTTANGTFTANGTTTLHAALVDAAGNTGSLGQLLSSTGSHTQWIDAPLTNTDSQTLSATLNTNTLTLVISNGNTQTLDLASINSDAQDIDALVFNSSTNSLTVGITGGSSQTISLAALANSGTDSQTIAFGSSATVTQTTLEIANGNSLSLQASGSLQFTQTGTNTLALAVTPTDVTKITDTDGDTQVQVEADEDDDTIRFATAGTEHMRIATTGNIGVGTTSPTYSLSVRNQLVVGGLGNNQLDRSNGADAIISSRAENPGQLDIAFFDGNSYLNHSNFQEIGRLRFTANEAISGETEFNATLKEYASIRAQLSSSSDNGGNIRGDLVFATTNSGTNAATTRDRMIIKANGRVGIGTTSPAQTLTVSGSAQVVGAFYDASGNAGIAGQLLSSTGTGLDWIDFAANSLTDTDGDTQVQVEKTTDDDSIRFDTAGEERLVISANGNVGIGVGSPTYNLDINGTYRVVTIVDNVYSNNSPDATRNHNSNNLEGGPDYTDGNATIYTTFTTGSDITRNQIIYEAGGTGIGTAFGINQGNFEVFAGSSSTVHISSTVLPNTAYSAAVVYDLTGNELRLYLKTTANVSLRSSDLAARATFTANNWAGSDGTGVGNQNGSNRSSYSGNLAFAGTGLTQIHVYSSRNIDSISSVSIPGSSTSRFVINDSGNVGIGTESPTNSLTVSGTAQITAALYDASGDAGTAGQLLSSTGNELNWIDAPEGNTDSQTLSASLDTNTLALAISNGNTQTVDLASLNTDAQDIDALTFNSSTNSLTVGITGGSSQTISLAALANSGTDSQTLSASLDTNTLTLVISNGNTQTVDLASLNTDAQDIDALTFNSSTNSLTVGITGGSSQTISLAALANSGTDSQTIAFGSSATATQTTLEIADGNSLSLQASGSLRFTQTGTDTLVLAVMPTDVTKIIDTDGDTQVQVEEGTDDDSIRFDTAGQERMLINSSGKVGIGVSTVNASATLEVNGDVYATNMYLSSDARYKTNVQDLLQALETVLQLRGVKHNWTTAKVNGKTFSPETTLGFIAQEVEQHLPELVRTDAQGYKTVDYAKISVLLVEAVKAQQKQLNAQEERLKRIENELGIED